jgi:hypothetical protein
MKRTPFLIALFSLFSLAGSVAAAPIAWEPDFGPVLDNLTGDDDSEDDVVLSFPFPFEGTTYTTVFVGTNGGIQLGDLGDDDDLDYDIWEYLDEFYDDESPILLALNTDLDLGTTGTVHFKDFGNRAVFTWNEVGTNEELEHLCSFQIQLFPDGRIYFSYNGILDGIDEDLVDSLDEGILVGISGSTGTDPGASDLSGSASTDTDTLYEVWNNKDDPDNSLFDLDMKTLVFTPKSGGGFSVGFLELMTSGPSFPDLLIGKKTNSLTGDGIRNPRIPSKRQTITHSRRIFTSNTSTAHLMIQNDGASEGTFTLRSSGDRFPRMTVSAQAVGIGNVSAAIQTGRFNPKIAAGGSVRVIYELKTDRFYAGVLRDEDRDDTVRFELSGGGSKDVAAMVNSYR